MSSTPEPQHPVIGETIRSLRREAGLTQSQLFWKSDIHWTEISRLERGWRNPTWETMKKVAKGLDVPCWQMVKRAERLDREREARRAESRQ